MEQNSARVRRLELLLALFILFWSVLVNLLVQSFLPSREMSWQGALSYFVFKGLQFGSDVIFTYGPWGYITADTYSGYLLASRIGFDVVVNGIFAFLMAVCATRLRSALRWLFVVNICLFSPVSDAVYLFAIALSACFMILSQESVGSALGGVVLLAFTSLIKFTYFLLSAASLLVVVIYALSKQKWLRAGGLTITYLASLLFFWCLAGQHIFGFFPFLHRSCEIASGYAGAMAINESWPVFCGGLSAFLLCAGILVGLTCASRNKGQNTAMLIVWCISLFLAWKEGFVRADPIHFVVLLAFVLFALPAAWAVFEPPSNHRQVLLGMTLIALFSPYVLIRPRAFAKLLSHDRDRVVENVTALIHPFRYCAAVDAELSQAKEQNALPAIKHLVGKESVDVYGHEQAIALLNDLNYRPRPVFQGYSAYTAVLVSCNRRFYQGPAAPAFVILKYQTVDDRYPAEDDAGTMEVILCDYEPIASEKSYMLWKRKADSLPLPRRRLLREGTAAWGDSLSVLSDQCPVWIEVEVGETWLGRLREFLYKPAMITMTLQTVDHESQQYRFVRSVAGSGFVVNPALRNSRDLLEMYRNPGKGNVSSVTLEKNDSVGLQYSTHYRYRIYAEGLN